MADYTRPSGSGDLIHDEITGTPDPASAVAAAQARMTAATSQLEMAGSAVGVYIAPVAMNDLSTSSSASEMTELAPPTPPPGL